MRKSFTSLSSLRGPLLGLAMLGLSAGAAQAQTVYGLSITSNPAAVSLVTFSATAPGTFTATVPITGFTAGQAIVGIDVRPNTGELFALGYNPTGTQAQLYVLNRTTGVATAVGAALTLNLGTTTSRIGFDFNPTVDRIRVTSAARTNFRLNPNNGALAATDGTLTYATADANTSQTPGVGSSAYTNSYIGSTATTLYNLDEANSRLVTQAPPNDGTLNTVGALGIATNGVSQASDLDIYYNASTGTNVAYLTTAISTSTTAATSTLYTVNLTTGAATAVGALGTGALVAITDITFAIDRPATLPAITGQLAYALAGTNLITFDTGAPSTIRTSVGITGVDATQTLAGLDVRPLNNSLYGLGYNAAAATGVANAQLYSINAVSGVATPIGAAVRLELGTGSIGFDFNPTVDRIRVVGANRNNYRLNPTNPATGILAATDGQVAYTTGTNTPSIGAVAYTNSFMGASATSGTTLFNYDEALNVLNTQATANPPADGQLTTIGSSGIAVNTTAPNVDLDIYSTGVGANTAYLVANTGTSANTSLYTVNLATGAATLVGAIGNGIAARDIAVAASTGVVTSNRSEELATSLSLYPNPLAGSAAVAFGLPRAAHVELTVSDALGRTVDKVDAGLLPAGPQLIRWNRQSQAAGMYFFRLSFDGQPAGTRQGMLTQ
ncbi:DUF4394 domain-containing protein [Hymenobacter sp. HMF4947]|uniref:DUF4394 domain-containing protein n=1 Tax=Hymenobacter ginkgonis TaxID=2682976 RepID=A0A7K1TJL6_9BACT|nr:DUF4394 domain-containing protein [Hymenobacter ginkgonis]MVN78526.1 DUF4394 domain-containing protein [Hymenobacter ginkgonis]